MGKSYVRTERRLCMVCSKRFATGALLIVRHKSNAPDEWGMCPTHQALKDRNYIALVEVDKAQSIIVDENHMLPEDAKRTGTVVHMRRDIFQQFFHEVPPDIGVCYVSPEVIALLQVFHRRMQGKEDN